MLHIDELKFDEKGLIPAIVVDAETQKVLTLAYMNRRCRFFMEKISILPIWIWELWMPILQNCFICMKL